jgi:cell shape-determining protein MreD
VSNPIHRGGIVLLVLTVIVQFLLEVTLGRVLVAPNLLSLALVYLMLNRSTRWSVDGAFWSGLCLDLLLHQPLGASSLALMCGLYISRRLAGASAGESRVMLLVLTALASIVSDSIFIVVASLARGWHAGQNVLVVVPRAIITLGFGILLFSMGFLLDSIRHERHA